MISRKDFIRFKRPSRAAKPAPEAAPEAPPEAAKPAKPPKPPKAVKVPKGGELVRLKSGGPIMTVWPRDPNRGATALQGETCVWFDRTGVSHQSWFPYSILTIVRKPTP
jgi:uncharacterized protein YodC (DUF2158 family)